MDIESEQDVVRVSEALLPFLMFPSTADHLSLESPRWFVLISPYQFLLVLISPYQSPLQKHPPLTTIGF